tara:strand:+ start:112 stop:240 length:129 start_codon:yes stop_codon:yes gene_type:complete
MLVVWSGKSVLAPLEALGDAALAEPATIVSASAGSNFLRVNI